MDALKKCPILQNATEGNKLAKAANVWFPQFWTNRQNGFGFGRKIESVLRFVVVKAVHAVSVVAGVCSSSNTIQYKSVKHAVQSRGERRVFFVETNKIRRAACFMPILFEVTNR